MIVIIGSYVRTKVSDALIFEAARHDAEAEHQDSPGVFDVVKGYPPGVLTAMGLRFGENIMYYLVATFTITYLKIVANVPTTTILLWMLIAHAVHFAAIPVAGWRQTSSVASPSTLTGAILGGFWGSTLIR